MSSKSEQNKEIVLLDKQGNTVLPNENDLKEDNNDNNKNEYQFKSSTAYGGLGATPNCKKTNFNISNEKKKLKLDEKVKLDNVGPIVLNVDGTTSYIKDWNEKTDDEKSKLLKFIAKRNKKRQQELLLIKKQINNEKDNNNNNKN